MSYIGVAVLFCCHKSWCAPDDGSAGLRAWSRCERDSDRCSVSLSDRVERSRTRLLRIVNLAISAEVYRMCGLVGEILMPIS
jgi:hypothetical protein